jgi:3-dehydroquinate synthase
MNDIIIKENGLNELKELVDDVSPYKTIIITDKKVYNLFRGALKEQIDAEVILIPGGEEAKTLKTFQFICDKLIFFGFTRKSLLIGLGGGSITDIASFVASTYMRGTYLGLIPTTLLAQIDAAIGGKTGIDYKGKNLIGTFYAPAFTIIDPVFLKTLPKEEFKNGLGELVKYALLNEGIYEKVCEFEDISTDIIKGCVEFKLSITNKDFKEGNERRILNLGHTVAHAIEKASDYEIPHGAAVSIGLMANALMSERILGFDSRIVKNLLVKYNLPQSHSFGSDKLLSLMSNDKKAWEGEPVFVLLEGIGKPIIRKVEKEIILSVLEELHNG